MLSQRAISSSRSSLIAGPFARPCPSGVRGSATVKAISLGTLNRRQALRAPRAQLLGLDVGIGDDGCHDRLAPLGVRAAVDGRLDHVGVRLEHRLDLGRRHVLAAGDDRVGLAPGDGQRAVGAPLPQVAGGEHGPIRPARRHRRPADEDLAVAGHAHARAEQRRAERGDLRARLGQPVGRRHRHAGRGRPSLKRGGRRRAAEQRPAQRRRLAQPGVEQALQRGGDERDDRRPVLAA